MKITKGQLRRIIRGNVARLDEGVWEYVKDFIDPSGWVFSGAGAGIDEDELKLIASPDAWILFKAMGGLGTNEDAVVKVIDKRVDAPGGLKKLSAEFDQLRHKLVKMRGSAKANILQGILGFVGGAAAMGWSGSGAAHAAGATTASRVAGQTGSALSYLEPTSIAARAGHTAAKFAGMGSGGATNIGSATGAAAQVGINKLMQSMQDRDLATWLASDGMEKEAKMVNQAIGGPVSESRYNRGWRKMRITKRQLRRIIKEERYRLLREQEEVVAAEEEVVYDAEADTRSHHWPRVDWGDVEDLVDKWIKMEEGNFDKGDPSMMDMGETESEARKAWEFQVEAAGLDLEAEMTTRIRQTALEIMKEFTDRLINGDYA